MQTIFNWGTGKARATIDKAIELAQIYGVLLDSFAGGAKSETKKQVELRRSM